MKVIQFTLDTQSMLPEWRPRPALVCVRNEVKHNPADAASPDQYPSHAFRFHVRLRVERKTGYYVLQIFVITTLIVEAAMLGLVLAPGRDGPVGDRLGLHSSGLLTLIAFKYGIAQDLPSVPYTTFLGRFLTGQIFTLVLLSAETVMAFKLVSKPREQSVTNFHHILLAVLCVFWFIALLYVALFKRGRPWKH